MIDSYKEAESNEAMLYVMGNKMSTSKDEDLDDESSEDDDLADETSFNLRTLNLKDLKMTP